MLLDHHWMLQLVVIGQIILAMFLGGIIGFERELANKPAGFRTHTLVAGAAAAFMGISRAAADYYRPELGLHGVEMDLLRVAAAIVTGVSFLGAGTIFKDVGSGKVGGLTTAATIWVSAAVGMATALGQLLIALGLTLITLAVLRGMKWLEKTNGHG
ncbi:MAG TPA: MgtC/SapB family protein [Gammaproteobacteria bacterium]|nr:MgtC/SapB family protein [Gammaproteobacteria bacterium]